LAVVAALAGCQEPVKVQPAGATPDRAEIEAAVQALGGREAWAKVQDVGALALVSIYADTGEAIVSRQIQTFDLVGGTLVARGVSPGGPWCVKVSRDGTRECQGRFFAVNPSYRKLFTESIALLLHRVSGPLNFVFGTETSTGRSNVTIDRIPLIRIGIGGKDRGADACFFDPKTRLLRFVTAGGEQPGQDGTVTEYTYEMLPNGMAFPSLIRVVKIGRTQFRGPQVIVEVEISSVRIR
jgi:hypothetical protein